MKISIKNLKGEVFTVEAELTDQVLALKGKIQSVRSDLLADRQKLIHAGKVLKDEQLVQELGLGESDFIVCMVTKEVAKKTASAPNPPQSSLTTPPAKTAPTAPVVPTAPIQAPAPSFSTSDAGSLNSEAIQALVNMGFPESDVRAALTAAMGNPDVAYEFLLGGIPDHLISSQAPTNSNSNVSIEQLRQHPQFNMLKQLVQQNPAALPQVLDLIGQQSPSLYAAIQANNDAFIAMMNEPIAESPTQQSQPSSNLAGALGDPNQVMQLLASLPPAQRVQFAQSAGINPQELEELLTILGSLPAEQRQQFLGGAVGGRSPAHVVRLTEEEMAAVNRLTELGFSRQQAAQAYLACDKDEQLAANFLLGGGFDDDMNGFGGDDGGDDHDHDDDHDMYS
mmetsp:Transcript_23088/g.17505  ORF Transcript_23088/g.17505 Transcript_23088/m.17505 type:complete len:395 (+) Transcript_23088:51-1235(+)